MGCHLTTEYDHAVIATLGLLSGMGFILPHFIVVSIYGSLEAGNGFFYAQCDYLKYIFLLINAGTSHKTGPLGQGHSWTVHAATCLHGFHVKFSTIPQTK